MTDASTSTSLQLGAGWRAWNRPLPGFGHTLGAAAGLFAVVAVISLAAEIAEDEPRIAGTIASVALVVLALAAATALAGPVRSASITTLVLSVPLAFGFLILAENDSPSRDDVTLLLVLTLVVYLALYFAGATRGRAIFLGLALFALWIVILVQVGTEGTLVPFQDEISRGAGGVFGDNGRTIDDASNDVSIASLVIGVVMLAVAMVMDRRRLEGAATPFVVVGAVATFVGAIALAVDEDAVVGGLLLTGAGVLVGITGGLGCRRASTWVGGLGVAVGLAIVIDDLDGDSEWGTIALAAGATVVLLAIGTVLAARLQEPPDGQPVDLVPVPAPAPAPAPSAAPPPSPEPEPASESVTSWTAPPEARPEPPVVPPERPAPPPEAQPEPPAPPERAE